MLNAGAAPLTRRSPTKPTRAKEKPKGMPSSASKMKAATATGPMIIGDNLTPFPELDKILKQLDYQHIAQH